MNQKKEPQGPTHGFDGAGHMDPAHAKRLLELGREGKESDTEVAFVKKTHTNDDLAEELAESAVASMNSVKSSSLPISRPRLPRSEVVRS